MMTQAFYTGISGLRTNSTGIDVVSDNIANINTTGYRAYNVEFSSLFEERLNTDNAQNTSNNTIGIGATVQATTLQLTSGTLQLSDRSTDLAIVGSGWFGVQAQERTLYTRDGGFTFDANSNLVTGDGYHVLGTLGGNITDNILTNIIDDVALTDVTAQTPLRFPKTLHFPSIPTSNAKFSINLGTSPEVKTISASVIDSQDNKNALRLKFTKVANTVTEGSQWTVSATITSFDGLTTYDTQEGNLIFDNDGALTSNTLGSIDNNGTPVKIDLGNGFTGVVSTGNPNASISVSSNGVESGDLTGYSINQNSEVIATFSNSRQSAVGKVAVFHFKNDKGLNRLTGTRFEESANSGNPLFFKDATGKNINGSNVVNFNLEGSNYDLTNGLTELIILQRAYDASSKSITTADQMMQKALSMDA